MQGWPPPGDSRRPLPRRHSEGEYSVQAPRPEPAPVLPEAPALTPAEDSQVGEIVARLHASLREDIARIERAMIGPSSLPELSAALTLSERGLKKWRVLAAIGLAVGSLLGVGGTKAAVDPPTASAEVVDRVDALEERFARIERKLDRLLPP